MAERIELTDVPAYIDGRDQPGDGRRIVRENPARIADEVGSVSGVSPAQAESAVASARRAAAAWTAMDVAERADRLRRAWDLDESTRAGLAGLLTSELGKGRPDTRGELDYGIAYAHYLSDAAPAALADRIVTDDEGRFLFRRLPYGVVVAIIPWNAPLNIASMLIAPALVTGNTVVVKPSPLSPLAVTNYLRHVAAALPPGVLNVVNGDGDVGEALVSHPDVGKIAFTGSTQVGGRILQRAAGNIVPCLLELGGNDPAVILEDAPLTDGAISRMIFGTFLTAGQVCMAIKRLLVHESILDRLVERYRTIAADALIIGDPADPRVTMGPLVSRQQADRVRGMVEEARASGATVFELGSTLDDFDEGQGYFVRPTLVTGAGRTSRLVAEEQFGPTVPVVPFRTVDEAVAIANETPFGLCASVWSSDEERAFEVGSRLAAGTIFVNTHNRSGMTFRAPIGGLRWSGYGRNGGNAGLEEFSQTQTVSLLERTRTASDVGAARDYVF